MTDKAYIVANEQQEREVLENLGHEGLIWTDDEKFPYMIVENSCVYRDKLEYLQDEEIIFDGRNEERMSEKYVVSQEFMNELEEWKKQGNAKEYFVGPYDISMLPDDIKRWWNYAGVSDEECNNRLIAIIRWVNGEDVFEVEKPKKWIVRSKGTDDDDNYSYVFINLHNFTLSTYHINNATKFDTKEEAESWANSYQEVVEVEE